jgi:hypothetical protein
MKRLVLFVLLTIATNAFAKDIIWDLSGIKVLDFSFLNIKRDFERDRQHYSWVSFRAYLLDKEPQLFRESPALNRCDYPRNESRKSKIMWTCIDEATKKLRMRSGDFFIIIISVEKREEL